MNTFDLKTVVVGPLQTNCYILTINDKTYIIDPGEDAKVIDSYLDNKNVVAILVTHHHFDHIGALDYFENKYNLKHNNYKDLDFEIIKNPGHSKDSISFYFKDLNIMFCGDFIFKNSIGRMDLEGGSELEMQESLEMISKYKDNTILYPGHGPSTILGNEKSHFKYYF